MAVTIPLIVNFVKELLDEFKNKSQKAQESIVCCFVKANKFVSRTITKQSKLSQEDLEKEAKKFVDMVQDELKKGIVMLTMSLI